MMSNEINGVTECCFLFVLIHSEQFVAQNETPVEWPVIAAIFGLGLILWDQEIRV